MGSLWHILVGLVSRHGGIKSRCECINILCLWLCPSGVYLCFSFENIFAFLFLLFILTVFLCGKKCFVLCVIFSCLINCILLCFVYNLYQLSFAYLNFRFHFLYTFNFSFAGVKRGQGMAWGSKWVRRWLGDQQIAKGSK